MTSEMDEHIIIIIGSRSDYQLSLPPPQCRVLLHVLVAAAHTADIVLVFRVFTPPRPSRAPGCPCHTSAVTLAVTLARPSHSLYPSGDQLLLACFEQQTKN